LLEKAVQVSKLHRGLVAPVERLSHRAGLRRFRAKHLCESPFLAGNTVLYGRTEPLDRALRVAGLPQRFELLSQLHHLCQKLGIRAGVVVERAPRDGQQRSRASTRVPQGAKRVVDLGGLGEREATLGGRALGVPVWVQRPRKVPVALLERLDVQVETPRHSEN